MVADLGTVKGSHEAHQAATHAAIFFKPAVAEECMFGQFVTTMS